MRGSPVTLRDVASLAGVHASTASRALNGHSRALVNAGTVTRVLEAADELGYRPNSLARGLKTNRTATVGMIVPDLTNPLFPPIVRGIEDSLGAADYTLVLGNTDNDPAKERSLVATMNRRRVDGLVLATARRESLLFTELAEAELPMVLVNRVVDDSPVSSVTPDNRQGIALAVRHLVDLGHTRIGHIAGVEDTSTGRERRESFRDTLRELGLEADPQLVVQADWFQEEPGSRAFAELLDRGLGATAVVAANDLIALGCYDVLTERGLSCPGDLSITGFNDIPYSDKFSPPLTSVRIPQYDIGLRAGELLLRAIEDPDAPREAVRLPGVLVVRGSTAALGG